MAGQVTLSGYDSSAPGGTRGLGPITTVGSVTIGETLAVPLAMGDNSFSVPVGAVGVVIVGPTISAISLTYRTNLNSGDAGLPISPLAPFVHCFPAVIPTSIILHASAAQASPISLWYW